MKKLLFALFAIAPVVYGQYAAPAAPAPAKDAAAAPATTEATKAATGPAATAADGSALTTRKGSEAGKVKTLLGDRNCVQQTGSNIVRKGTCVNATGQAYGQTEIERTGTYNTGTALQRLSPSIQVQPGH